MGKKARIAACAAAIVLWAGTVHADPCDDLADAAEVGDTAEMRRLMNRGVPGDCISETWEGATPLHIAAENYQPQAVRLLLRAGVDPNVHDDLYDETPLQSIAAQLEGDSCTGACAEVVRILHGAGGQ